MELIFCYNCFQKAFLRSNGFFFLFLKGEKSLQVPTEQKGMFLAYTSPLNWNFEWICDICMAVTSLDIAQAHFF